MFLGAGMLSRTDGNLTSAGNTPDLNLARGSQTTPFPRARQTFLQIRDTPGPNRKSNILDEIPDANTQRLGDPPKRRQRNVFFTTLHPPQIIRMEISFFRQNFLCEP